ncbi:hypothetical protein [Streptomyces sp. NPDC050287]|uniref:hypothetical protein n=1 Tax=Streptomyces sp. NPDC050287 TaxID=3365608 RepID=UPI0037B94C5E
MLIDEQYRRTTRKNSKNYLEGIMAVSAPTLNNEASDKKASTGRKILFGTVSAALAVVLAAGGAYWWHQHNKLSQASMVDCQLAQKLVDSAQHIPDGTAAIDKWEKSERQRRSQMKDGYLGANISVYDGWALGNAKGQGTPPSKSDVKQLEDTANRHCIEAGIEISLPQITS